MEDNFAVLLPNHGALSVGPNMPYALKVNRVLEKNAKVYLYARMVGHPQLIDEHSIETMQDYVREHYGKSNDALVNSK